MDEWRLGFRLRLDRSGIVKLEFVTHSLEKFYQIQNFTNFYSWEDADLEERKEFLNKFKNQNSQCLITYLKENYSWCTGDIAQDYNALNKQNERMEKWLTVF